jgi:hypothetical protein
MPSIPSAPSTAVILPTDKYFSLTVSNMDRAVEFFTKVLSFVEVSDTEGFGEVATENR